MPRPKPDHHGDDAFDGEIKLARRALRAALVAARGASRVPMRDGRLGVLRASRHWCSVAAKHLERAIAAAAESDAK